MEPGRIDRAGRRVEGLAAAHQHADAVGQAEGLVDVLLDQQDRGCAQRPLAQLLAGPLEALTPFTPADAAGLAAALARIRERGWELGINDVVEGLCSVGIPVRDRGGTVIAAISISGLPAHILADDKPRHLAILQRRARELELRLG